MLAALPQQQSIRAPKSTNSAPGLTHPCHCRFPLRHTGPIQHRSALHLAFFRQHWICSAGKGFGDTSTKSKGKKERQAWTEIGRVDSFPEGKSVVPITLPSKNIVMLYKSGDSFFCSAPNSTAYQFPLSNARVHQRGGKAAIEVPFDGTVYDLQTGKVLEWCPKNNPLRFVLGSLKEKATREDLQVFPCEVEDGAILVKFG